MGESFATLSGLLQVNGKSTSGLLQIGVAARRWEGVKLAPADDDVLIGVLEDF